MNNHVENLNFFLCYISTYSHLLPHGSSECGPPSFLRKINDNKLLRLDPGTCLRLLTDRLSVELGPSPVNYLSEVVTEN